MAFHLVWEQKLSKPKLFKKRFVDLFNFAVLPFYWAGYERKKGVTEQKRIMKVARELKALGLTLKG